MHELIIRGGTAVSPGGVCPMDVAVDGDKITALYRPGTAVRGGQEIDAAGLYILPGLIDPHVHIGYPDWDWVTDCRATTRAAALGGVTTVIDFLAEAAPLEQQLSGALTRLEGNAWVNVAFHAGVFTRAHMDGIPAAARAGLPSFKFYLPYNGRHVPPEHHLTDGRLWESFRSIAALPSPAIATVHAENQELIDAMAEEHPHRPDAAWSDIRPVAAEVESISRVGLLAREADCPLYIVHVSSAWAVEEIGRLRRQGGAVWGETCAHYLALNNSCCDRTLGKINPPLREAADNDALWQAVADGVISCIGSDHSSCARHHKKDFESAIPGFAGVETTLPVLLEGVSRGKITLPQLVAASSANPARLFGLDRTKGWILPGWDADLVLVDPAQRRTVSAAHLSHISDYTPFEGMELRGAPVMTLLAGKVVARDHTLVAQTPGGRFIPRPTE